VLFRSPERPDQITVLDKALGVVVEGGSQTPVALDLPGADVTKATGTVYDDNGSPVAGATVFVTDADGGLAGYAVTDGSGNYTLHGLAASEAGILYTVTARRPGGGQVQKAFLAQSGGITEIPSLDLPYDDVMNLTVRKNFHVETTLDHFDGAAHPNLPVQPRGEVWFGRPTGGQDQLLLPDVDWMTGRAVENVFAQHLYMPMYGGPQNEALPPGYVEMPNSPASRYKWTDLPSLAADLEDGRAAIGSFESFGNIGKHLLLIIRSGRARTAIFTAFTFGAVGNQERIENRFRRQSFDIKERAAACGFPLDGCPAAKLRYHGRRRIQ